MSEQATGNGLEALPSGVRVVVEAAVVRLQRLADALEQGRTADRMFGGNGRYEADAWRNIGSEDGARQTLAKFRALAPGNGVNAEAVLAALGLPSEAALTPSAAARGW